MIQKRRFGRILLTVTIFCILFLQETNVNSQTNWPWVNKKKTGETPFYRGGENSSASTKEEKEVPASMTLPEIQGAVMSFADTFAAMVGDFATILENQATSAQGRINAAKMRLWGISSVLQIASGPYPGVALLDMVVLTTLNRIVWEEFWRPKVYGEQADLMVDALRKLEADIWGIAAKVLTTDQQKEMRELILEWRKKNPEKNMVNYVRFSDFGELGRKPTLENVIEPGGLLAPVKEAVEEAAQIRELIERAVFLFSRQLLLVNYQAELLYLELVSKPEVQNIISNIGAFKETSERYADMFEQMPKQIADQSNMAVDELMEAVAVERDTAITQALDGIGQEREKAISQAFEGIAKQLDATMKQALEGVEQQRQAVVDQLMENVTIERKATVVQVLEGVEQIGKDSVIYLFLFCVALVVIFFLAMFFYRYASSKIISTKNSRT